MVGDHVRGVDTKSRTSRARATAGARCRKRAWLLEGLEDRLLLSGSPTIYTVNSTNGGVSGSGDSGTLPYVIGLANADSNTAGSEIQFDPTVFASPQTITLSSTLELSETAGPEVIDGPWRQPRADGQRQRDYPGFHRRQQDDGHLLRPDDLRRGRGQRSHRQLGHDDGHRLHHRRLPVIQHRRRESPMEAR